MIRAPAILPQYYYHDHFLEMIGFVSTVYAGFLGDDERAFIDDFNACDMWAQCLYVRMCNRKKAVFTPDDLRYSEIGDIWPALDELKAAGFIREVDETDYKDCLADLSKPALLGLARDHALNEVKSSWSKAALVDHVFDHLSYADFFANRARSTIFVPTRKATLGFLLYLYFGKLDDNLTRFAMRDLGLVTTRAHPNYQARFDTPNEARAGFFYKQALKGIKAGADAKPIWEGIEAWPVADTDFAISLRNSLLHQLGLAFEKRKDHEAAKAAYRLSTAFESQERLVRILYAQGALEDVKSLLDTMLQSPDHDEASVFASDFFSRKFGQQRTGIYTQLLRDAQSLAVDALYRGDPELGAMGVFERDGWACHHTENSLWPTLFALLFWDALFEGEAAFSSDFDPVPKVLKDKTFHTRFADTVKQKCEALRAGQGWPLLQAAIQRHQGKGNGLFNWFDGLEPMLGDLLQAAPPQAVADLIGRLAVDFYALRDGFPDLMLRKGGQLRFVEIKGEGDQIRRNQLARLNLLRSLGFEAGICRVSYHHDPDQVYVVVDVETTGGRPPNDRVTEIGAVKVRRGEIIGEWSSLINPEKRIPAFITQLTGISNAMVAQAPRFAEIADEFAQFMSGAIFVAHNVNFDYGFISSEFRRLERRFRHPKLCTVASMRKAYPGLPSYGLANLAKEYGITLTSHHRALADARAAAALLGLVIEKRLPAQALTTDVAL
jgi:DNA polymerase III subunit epsilon